MKACKTLLLLIFLLSCQNAFTQTLDSLITIRMSGGKAFVSGIVGDDLVKKEVVEKIKTQFGGNVDFSKLIIERSAEPFRLDWQTELDKSLLKIKGWKSGVFIFGNTKNSASPNYPALPEKILSARFSLVDRRTVSLRDFQNKVVVVFLFAPWIYPATKQAFELNDFYTSLSSKNVEILALDTDDSSDDAYEETMVLRKFLKRANFRFKFGWANENIKQYFFELSKLRAVPQAIVTLNGKLHGVFTGGSASVEKKLEETIIKTLDENNLQK